MSFAAALRREASRAVLRDVARTVTFDLDVIGKRDRRSRTQHLRNGTAAVLDAGSDFLFQPTAAATFYYLTRARIRAELRYGARELGRAFAPPATVRKHPALALALLPLVGVAVALAARGRHGGGDDEILV